MSPLVIGLLVLGRIATACWANVLQKRAINDARLAGKPPTRARNVSRHLDADDNRRRTMVDQCNRSRFNHARIPTNRCTGVRHCLAVLGLDDVACALEVPGNFLLLRSIQRTDLSIFGPLNSYKPVVGLLLGWWILAEMPTLFGVVGMGIVLLGSLLLADRSQTPEDFAGRRLYFGLHQPGVRDRLIAVALTAAGSIFLKLAMQHRDTVTSLAAWSLISWLLAFGWLLIDRGSMKLDLIRILWHRDLIGIAANMIAMQGLTILVFQVMNVGYALALFQLGSLVSVYLGHRLFGEVDLYRRLLAASIMFIGAVVIMLAG